MEELHIQKSSDLPNNSLIFRFELQISYIMEPQYEVATERSLIRTPSNPNIIHFEASERS
ncbi:uncharacterized protein K441DRAFT_666479 [Cenococcum geophilum 1.58]|uniref:uncharacterized protein n=1 Tax=Cenococcum geophilum 1.58 TaxID=794803 RepID=UPI00358E44CF|nr:hypothetical protein K441DRAFT_666479 [Cenococcum geophilum 1.58]